MNIIEFANTRPVRTDASDGFPTGWIFKRHRIGVLYSDRMFWIHVTPCDEKGHTHALPKAEWSVFHHQNRSAITSDINRLLNAACGFIDLGYFPICNRSPFNKDSTFTASVNKISGRKYKIRVKDFELAAVIEQSSLEYA